MVRRHGTVSTYVWGCRCEECHVARMAYDRAYQAKRREAGYVGAIHGSLATYRYGCRCELCKERNRAYQAERIAKVQASGYAGYEHGTATTYRMGCRCAACRMGVAIARQLKLKAKGELRRHGETPVRDTPDCYCPMSDKHTPFDIVDLRRYAVVAAYRGDHRAVGGFRRGRPPARVGTGGGSPAGWRSHPFPLA